MSNFVLPKSSPSRFQSLSQKLLSPTGIAVLASLGIHAALGASLPYFSADSKEKAPPRTVQLVQLSPAEQSRLPQLSPSPLPLNQLQALPGLSTPYPPLTGLGLPSNLSPVNPPTNGLLSKTPQTTVLTPSTTTNKTKPQANNDKKVTERKLAPYQGGVKIEASNQREKFSSGGRLPNLNLTAADYSPANPPLPPPTLYPPAPTGNQTVSQQVAPPSQSSNLPQFSNQQQARGTSRTPTPLESPIIIGSTGTNNPTSTAQSPSQELVGIKPATGTPQLPTTPASAKPDGVPGGTGTSYAQQLQEGVKKHAPFVGSYPKGACESKASGTSSIAVKVDNKGTIVSIDPAPASNTILDQAAKAAVYERDLEVTGKPVLHLFEVEFKYDPAVCGTAAAPQTTKTPSTPTQTPANTIKPEPSSNATPQDAPAPKK